MSSFNLFLKPVFLKPIFSGSQTFKKLYSIRKSFWGMGYGSDVIPGSCPCRRRGLFLNVTEVLPKSGAVGSPTECLQGSPQFGKSKSSDCNETRIGFTMNSTFTISCRAPPTPPHPRPWQHLCYI